MSVSNIGLSGNTSTYAVHPSYAMTGNTQALCPDLLRYEQIGEADGWRGRVVRAFFWLLQVWPAR